MRKKVLHVVESLGGGVTTAINSYVKHSQQYKHYLLACSRNNDSTGEENNGFFEKIVILPRSMSSLLVLKKHIDRIDPHVVHLHSSFAGAICRGLPVLGGRKIVYTPHGFSFLRDDNKFLLGLYFWIEKFLSRRTDIIAGCSLHEMYVAKKQLSAKQCVEIFNICEEMPYEKNSLGRRGDVVIGMVGRVCKQKGYNLFKQVASEYKDYANFIWVGGGDSSYESELKSVGVQVTGWMPYVEVVDKIRSLDLLFYTAAWDGYPMSVLECARLGIPLILNKIDPFALEGLHTVCGVDESISEISGFLNNNEDTLFRALDNMERVNKRHSVENLRSSLDVLYSDVRHCLNASGC